ncbi:MAG: tripartite tricarboxylate transporter substrate binding protein [Proteobacteria bacterium]|nr:tripartite tricarboxylate transporter substrate binding protein [Pseudomonadota bacterium]
MTGALLCLFPHWAPAQAFPPPQINLVVPFPPGGPTDVLARHVAQALAGKLKVTVVVENRGGASAMIGSGVVARAAPDGATLLFQATHHVTNPVFFNKLPYDTAKDFSPIALVAIVPSALVVNPAVPARSVAELIALVKKDPAKFSTATFGGANQLVGELFKFMAGLDVTNIGYKGAAPALNDVIGGHVPMMFDSLTTVLPHIRSGKIVALGVTSAERSSLLPDVPTVAESGPLPGYEGSAWFGLFMPAANGNLAEKKLSEAMAEILATEEMRGKLRAMGGEPGTLTGDAFRKFVDAELLKWSDVGRRAKIAKE